MVYYFIRVLLNFKKLFKEKIKWIQNVFFEIVYLKLNILLLNRKILVNF